MKINYKITPDSGAPYEVLADSRDVIQWEKAGRGRRAAALEREPAMGDLAEIAWFAATRHRLHVGDLAGFLAGCAVETVAPERPSTEGGDGDDGDDGDEDPTPPAR